jgi:hypothetical protein
MTPPAFCILISNQYIDTLGSLVNQSQQSRTASAQLQAALRQKASTQSKATMADQTLVRPDTVDNNDGKEGAEVRGLMLGLAF